MGFKPTNLALILILLCLNLYWVSAEEIISSSETYIVHVRLPTADTQFSNENSYRSFLPVPSDDDHLVYSYKNVFKGFAAKLSPEQVKEMEKMPGFVSARPEKVFSLHTTHSPNFLGLQENNKGIWEDSNYGKGIIIGVLDSGINPDHPSFSDGGIPPPPVKWKGICQFNDTTKCNNKLIGARYFRNGNGSPMDQNGHGTHTASTAAGNFVKDANVYGNAKGTAAGIAPHAHLSIYKVCSASCPESVILAAMDIAIDDGVDILSLSLGGSPEPFYSDSIAIGAYTAMDKGIFVSCSAGNNGPSSRTLSNEAPWILTVGASTIDRKLKVNVMLGDNEEFLEGESAYHDFPPLKLFPLFFPGNYNISFRYCSFESLLMSDNIIDVRGKIVVCVVGGRVPRTKKGENVKAAGGVGMILINEENYGYTTLAETHVLPTSHLSYNDGLKVLSYINSSSQPLASISFEGTVIGNDDHAPVVAGFSSRGPSQTSPGILKPDIIGPGVNILAAWHASVENKIDIKSKFFNVISGTSMSCPHLSGIAALLKNIHPDWSPVAIKSAMMTTADIVNLGKNTIEDETLLPADAFATGSGHVDPTKATDPGLIYDIKPEDYIPYLCGLNYTKQQVETIIQRKVKMDCSSKKIPEQELNYPSFSIIFGGGNDIQKYTRTVTNVGDANSSYTVKVVAPSSVRVTVKPKILVFSELNQKLTYTVKFSQLPSAPVDTTSQGYLTWRSTNYSVRSPIIVTFGAMTKGLVVGGFVETM